AHRIGGTENRHGAGEAYALRSHRCGAEDDRRRRIQEILAMVLPDPKRVQPDLVGELNLFDQVSKAVAWIDRAARIGVCRSKAIDADLHLRPPAASSTDDELRDSRHRRAHPRLTQPMFPQESIDRRVPTTRRVNSDQSR